MIKMNLHITYYASLREQCGRSEESVYTSASNPQELYDEQSARYALRWETKHLTVAVNDQMVPWTEPLNDGDRVAFLPPVAGG
jgi:molybdopterin synthase sulfur carrier subunit